jgi:hypothetical protein
MGVTRRGEDHEKVGIAFPRETIGSGNFNRNLFW